MGQLVNGVWSEEAPGARTSSDGSFERESSPLRHWVENRPDARFPAAQQRYHLYINMGCPWAWRAVLMRALKGLEQCISMSLTQPGMGEQGWTFASATGESSDTYTARTHLHEVYSASDPNYTGRVTVPVLWDKEQQTIVNNESSEILRMLNSEFAAFSDNPIDYYPESQRAEIDAVNERVYANINNGVYRAGFARSQNAYEQACRELFAELDWVEQRLEQQRFLVGEHITEADWRLLSTLLRFDLAYYSRFRCNLRRIVDYPNLWAYARDLYQQPRVEDTIDWHAFKAIYWSGSGIIPLGPQEDWGAPHGRG